MDEQVVVVEEVVEEVNEETHETSDTVESEGVTERVFNNRSRYY